MAVNQGQTVAIVAGVAFFVFWIFYYWLRRTCCPVQPAVLIVRDERANNDNNRYQRLGDGPNSQHNARSQHTVPVGATMHTVPYNPQVG